MNQISLSKSFLETLQTIAAVLTLSNVSIPLGIMISFLAIYCLIKTNSKPKPPPRFQGEGIVEETIFPRQMGRVYFKGSFWFARCHLDLTLQPGDSVDVLGRQDLTLIVVPQNGDRP